MKRLLLALLFFPALSFAQAPAPTSTTLTQALTGPSPQTGSSTIMGNTVFLASRTGVIGPIVPGTTAVLLYVDREAMAVQSVNPNTGGITVERGYLGTQPTAHNSGATVLYGRTDIAAQTVFYTFDPAGACVAGNAPNPWINVLNANQWTCTGGVWVVSSAIYSTGSGLPAGCTSIPNVSLTCPKFIATSSFLNVGASAQELDLYTSGACDGVGACTGFKFGFLAPASMSASVVELLPATDAPNFGGVLQSDATQHLSWSVPTPLSGRWGMLGWNISGSAQNSAGILTTAGTTCTTSTNTNSSATNPPLRNCATGITANTTQWISFTESSDLTVGVVANPTNLRLITVGKQSATTTIRSWMAVLDDSGAATIGTADCPAATNLIGIRFSSVVPDTNFTLVNDNAGTCSTASTGVVGDTNVHRFEVRLNDATGTATGCVDGTCVSLATNYPGTFHPGVAAQGGAGMVLDNTTTTSETMSWSWIFVQSQLQ